MRTSGVWYMGAAGLVLAAVACSEPAAPRASDPASDARVMGLPGDYLSMAGGMYHKSCIHEVENGANVELESNGKLRVTRVDGSSYELPACGYLPFQSSTKERGALAFNPVASNDCALWSECARADPAAGNWWGRIGAIWTVPLVPYTKETGNHVYFTYPALQRASGSRVTIMQPVLQYGSNGNLFNHGGQYWSIMAVWGDSTGHYLYSTLQTVNPGDTLQGDVVTGVGRCSNNVCNWTISVYDRTTKQSPTQMSVNEVQGQNQLIGAAVEQHNLTSCLEFPRYGVTYSSITAYDKSWNPITPTWTTFNNTTVLNQCGFSVATTNTTATLGPFPVSPLDLSILGPTNINAPGGSCHWTATTVGGIPPYTYLWTLNSGNPGTGPTYTQQVLGQIGDQFPLQVVVTDSAGTQQTLLRILHIVEDGYPCS